MICRLFAEAQASYVAGSRVWDGEEVGTVFDVGETDGWNCIGASGIICFAGREHGSITQTPTT